jgi:hypothetical protein
LLEKGLLGLGNEPEVARLSAEYHHNIPHSFSSKPLSRISILYKADT